MGKTNIVRFKEDKGTLKKIWDKIVRKGVAVQQGKLKNAPVKLKIASVFIPEAAPVLNSLANFLKTDTGKSLTEISSKGYDMIGDVLTGDKEAAKQKADAGINFLSGDSALKIIRETSQFVKETGGRHL